VLLGRVERNKNCESGDRAGVPDEEQVTSSDAVCDNIARCVEGPLNGACDSQELGAEVIDAWCL
jgi:hypothetical protein